MCNHRHIQASTMLIEGKTKIERGITTKQTTKLPMLYCDAITIHGVDFQDVHNNHSHHYYMTELIQIMQSSYIRSNISSQLYSPAKITWFIHLRTETG